VNILWKGKLEWFLDPRALTFQKLHKLTRYVTSRFWAWSMKELKSRRHLRLVTEAERAFYEGPITRLGLWYRYPTVNYKEIVRLFLSKIILLRALIYLAFQY